MNLCISSTVPFFFSFFLRRKIKVNLCISSTVPVLLICPVSLNFCFARLCVSSNVFLDNNNPEEKMFLLNLVQKMN